MLRERLLSGLDVPPAVHGSLDFGELQNLGLRPDKVLDFSANINPFGPSPEVQLALGNTPLDSYPDRETLALRGALADFLAIPSERIIVGNGASELIWLTALAFVNADDTVLVIGPTYAEYTRAAQLMGGRVTSWLASAGNNFNPDVRALSGKLRHLRPEVVFVCNPNNPTGAVLFPEVLEIWARQFPETLFVVDEAYQPFAPGLGSSLELGTDNILVLRSMTKDFALAGLRLGYAVGQEQLIETLRQVQPPWSVNALAQAAGVAALRDLAYRNRTLEFLGRAKETLVAGLNRLGLPPVPSLVPFFLVRVGDGAAFRRTLLAHSVLVRDCASFGLPAYVRIATRRPEENERLLAVIREVR